MAETRNGVPSFKDLDDVLAAQAAKRNHEPRDLYPRDGSLGLFALEQQIAGYLSVRTDSLLLYNTGMSALVDALEVNNPTSGTKIIRGAQHYSQAGGYISQDLKARGVRSYSVDPGLIEDLDRVLTQHEPDTIFLETVTNGSEMAVLDIEQFLKLDSLARIDPVIILDHTLPTSSGKCLAEIIACSQRRVIGVESGTKFIGMNTEMSGIAYTNNDELLAKLKKRRQRTGSLLSSSAVETIQRVMPIDAYAYNKRNVGVLRNTSRLAQACYSAERSKGSFQAGFIVTYPNLPSHPQFEYSRTTYPDGAAPVFFIQLTDFRENGHHELTRALWENNTIRAMCELGQSFGFDKSRIWPDDNAPVVRISGGTYTEDESQRLENAFFGTLSSFSS